MGYELWTSPVTGYRRRGTRLSDFNEVFGRRILAVDICEPLKCCAAGAPVDEIRAELERLDFTVAGVREYEGGPVIGFVESSALEFGDVRDHLRDLSEVSVIPQSMDVVAVLGMLLHRPFVYVAGDAGVEAILTWADINKPMVRVYMFGLISLLEMHLSFWIFKEFSGVGWNSMLSDGRIEAAEKVQRKRRAEGQELALIQCLQLCDKRDLVLRSAKIMGHLGLNSRRSGEKLFKSIETLRNSLAHSQYDLVSDGSWVQLLGLVEQIQRVVQLSDIQVENDAMESSAEFSGLLW
ncbi:hypothetical protein [Stenotrophomonas sp. TD3]|uniref:hypothetical protein n=1 Tax=Stenotrophomonas sp. TD3 TaxID=1641707 RepID=UPI000B285C80|nr:hypothetical protein [Stenotrophomonas sp. TD3]